MTSVGVMASSVVAATAADVLMDPFNNYTFAPWTTTGSCSIVTGRTGTGGQIGGTPGTNFARYAIPTGNQSATLTIGFAYRVSNATGTRSICRLESDSGATSHLYVDVLTTGVLEIRINGLAGAVLASSPTSTIPINTYKYIEVQAVLHDTLGAVTLRVDGTQVGAATNLDTKLAGTKTVFDSVSLLAPNSGINNIFDDLYLTMGAGAAFKGSITIP